MKLNLNFLFKQLCLLTLGLLMTACGQKHFITDKNYRERVESDFTARMDAIGTDKTDALTALYRDKSLTQPEREAYAFMVAYAPLCDLGDLEPDYFLNQVRGAFRARDNFKWGAAVPEEIFRHFVLPHRVNNEYMDEARDEFFMELKDRISGLSMYEAALEVNHWCHEKVEYRATDARTSAPLALVKTSWGRCGEESAFTATALRAVGIPARQVYTPRWVHTDSNHAWVEVWIDGQWYFMGACEPEAELNVAWFTAPATRSMMMHTSVYGKYDGPEEVNEQAELYTLINLLDIYAPTREVTVRVTDLYGNGVPGANVKFKVYNYSQLYPIFETTTDTNGRASLKTGLGDIIVWASHGDKYGYLKLSSDNNSADIVLDRSPGEQYVEDYVIDVPQEGPIPVVPEDKLEENRRRLAEEDAIRNAYMATFADREYSDRLASETGLDPELVWKYVNASQGNWEEISYFIRFYSEHPRLFPFLASLYEKDLRDTPWHILDDHLGGLEPDSPGTPDSYISNYILSPRIGMELITPWRTFFSENIFKAGIIEPDPRAIAQWVRTNIRIDDKQNYINCRITPVGVYELRMADRRSRDVFFVALCRTAGIPARLEPASSVPQFYADGTWNDVIFSSEETGTRVPAKGRLTLRNDPSNIITPAYQTHYTIARFEDGDFRTLNLSGELVGKAYPMSVDLNTGYYRLMVGSRGNDGSMTVHSECFNIDEGGRVSKELSLPKLSGKLFVQGIVDMNTIVFLADGTKTTLKDLSNDKGMILIFADPATEPTRHILQELPSYKQTLEQWGGGILFMVPEDRSGATFNQSIFSGLPEGTAWTVDNGRGLMNQATSAIQMEFSNEFPLTLYLNKSGGVLFSNKGYRLGVIENMVQVMAAEKLQLQGE